MRRPHLVHLARNLTLCCCLATPLAASLAAQDITPVVHVDNPQTLAVQQAKHYVVLVSLDGFRYDYARKFGAPHLEDMAKNGVSTPDGMLPSYPSVTFPNHYTLVTGLRPEHHGIAAMEFYDPNRKAEYRYSDSTKNSDGSWYYGTPLWVLAEQQGMRSACFFWPGSEAAIDGVRPTFYLHFDDHIENTLRIDQVIAWLKLPPADRPHLITLYYSDVDHAGHSFGPDAPETRDAVHRLDDLIGMLRDKLQVLSLPVNLVVTADHGMVKAQGDPVVLDKYADLSHFKTEGALLYADNETDAARAYAEFHAHPDARFTAYRRLEVPRSLAYDTTPREGDPVIVPNGPYPIYAHAPTRKPNIGSHGFDPHAMPEMKAIFYAEGPDIAAGVKLKSFDNISVYPFITHLLGLETPAIDGTIVPLERALK